MEDKSINVDAVKKDIYECGKDAEGKLVFKLGYSVDINFVLWFLLEFCFFIIF